MWGFFPLYGSSLKSKLIPFWKIYFPFALSLEEARAAQYIQDFLSMTLPYIQTMKHGDMFLLKGDNTA